MAIRFWDMEVGRIYRCYYTEMLYVKKADRNIYIQLDGRWLKLQGTSRTFEDLELVDTDLEIASVKKEWEDLVK